MKNMAGVLFLVTILTGTGCATQKTWVYKANDYAPGQVGTGKTAVVLPFDDKRSNENTNAALMYMVPLMPFGWQDLDAPEGLPQHINSGLWINYKPTEDFAKALVEELRKAGLFNEVYFDYRKVNSDYYLQGKILKTKYKGRLYSYGLSIYGPLLWFVGIPSGTTKNELAVELSYMDTKTNKVLFNKTYEAEPRSDTSIIYNMKSDFNYAEMLAEIYKRFCEDIKSILSVSAVQS